MLFKMLLFLFMFSKCNSIQINYVKVPVAVQNNSGIPVTLDCDYTVRPDDQDLVLKWFLNEEVVYQWIPPKKPQSSGVLADKVDLSYEVSVDPKTSHRALKILNPTSEMAGEYKCMVSTFTDEDFSSKRMIVYEPERSLVLYKSKPEDGLVNFTCSAFDAFPQPRLSIFKDRSNDFYGKYGLEGVEWNIGRHPNGKYSVTVVSTAAVQNLNPGTLIHCEIRITGTGYVRRESLLYYPESDYDNGSERNLKINVIIILSLFLIV